MFSNTIITSRRFKSKEDLDTYKKIIKKKNKYEEKH